MQIYFPAQALEDSDCSETKKQLLEQLVRFISSVSFLGTIYHDWKPGTRCTAYVRFGYVLIEFTAECVIVD